MERQALAVLQAILRLIWPGQCLICGTAITGGEGGACPACWPQLQMISGLCCDLCGAPLPGAAPAGSQAPAAQCDDCLRHRPPWTAGRAAFLYEGAARALVLRLKHADRPDLAEVLAARLQHAAAAFLADGPMLIVPVPLHRLRLLRRRYNQSALLARSLSRRLSWPWCPDALLRARATPPQKGLSRVERQENLRQALRLHPRHKGLLRGRRVLLIDDVMTTGATLAEATRCLLQGGAGEVRVLTLARVARPP